MEDMKAKKTVRTKKVIKTLTIDRAHWGRGDLRPKRSRGSSLVHVDDGVWTEKIPTKHLTMCCLGFLGKRCGLSEPEMAGSAYPRGLKQELQELYPDWLDTNTQEELASINDSGELTEKEREAQVKEEFKKHGVTVKFVGKTPKSFRNQASKDNVAA